MVRGRIPPHPDDQSKGRVPISSWCFNPGVAQHATTGKEPARISSNGGSGRGRCWTSTGGAVLGFNLCDADR